MAWHGMAGPWTEEYIHLARAGAARHRPSDESGMQTSMVWTVWTVWMVDAYTALLCCVALRCVALYTLSLPPPKKPRGKYTPKPAVGWLVGWLN